MMKKSSVQMITKAVALAAAVMFGNTALAADYYWDNNAAAGFGTAGGTWTAPTLNLWSLDSTGVAAREASITTTTNDALHFGTATVGLTTGTITVTNTVSANSLTFGSASGHVTLSGGTSLTLGGTSPTITLNNSQDTITFPIAGTGGLTKAGTGQLRLSGNNTYSGATTISAGNLTLFQIGRLGGGSYSGNIIISGNFQYYSWVGQTLSGNISGTGEVRKVAYDSDLTLSGANTYSGATTVSAGRLVINTARALSPNTSVTVSTDQTSSGQLYFQQNTKSNTFNNAMTLSGLGFIEDDNTQIGAIRFEDGVTLGGTLTLTNDARVGILGTKSGTISGQVTGPGGLEFHGVKNSNNQNCTLTLSNTANDYAGTTTISSKDYSTTARTGCTTTLKLGAAGVIPDGAGKGIVALIGTNANYLTLLDLNGFNETVNGLTNSAAEGARITNTGAGTAILTVGAGDTNSAFSGVITEAGSGAVLALSKIGSGTLTLSATNSYTGATSVSGGTLNLTHAEVLASATAVEITNGAKIGLDFSGTNTVKSLTVNGKLLTRYTVYTAAKLPGALSGDGALYTLEGSPKGTLMLFR